MECQFQKNHIPCLRQVKSEVQTQEQTQEIRLSENLPDVGRVLCAWGQVVVRGKEWQNDYMGVNCGVMVWVLYAPEDGSPAQWVETWVPLNIRWDLMDAGDQGRILCHGTLRSVDARLISGRKIMVRVTVSMLAQAYGKDHVILYEPGEIPEDIRLKQTVRKVTLVGEMGEKPFIMDEEMSLPESAPGMDKLVRYSILPEVTEKKVLGDKVVFRGNTILHTLYRTVDGAMHSWDFEIPFSQYAELEQEYGHDAQAEMIPLITSLEVEPGEQGRIRLKAGLSGQYVIYDTKDFAMVEDAYSTERSVSMQTESIAWPAVLERQSQRIREEQTAPFGSNRIADVSFEMGNPRSMGRQEGITLEIPGNFQVLYYDREGTLQAGNVRWQTEMNLSVTEGSTVAAICSPSGKISAVPGEESTMLRGESLLHCVMTAPEKELAVTSVQIGDSIEKNPSRPSLILRRAGHEDLWSIAKKNGSTVESIRNANGLQGEPDPDQILLIPIA